MADQEFKGGEKARFPALLGVGILMAVVVVIVAIVIEPDYGIPLLILAVICVVAAIGYRVLAGSNRDDADSTDNVPKQPATDDRPLGDTPEAHDEISPHDLPIDAPGREAAAKASGGAEGTTRGSER